MKEIIVNNITNLIVESGHGDTISPAKQCKMELYAYLLSLGDNVNYQQAASYFIQNHINSTRNKYLKLYKDLLVLYDKGKEFGEGFEKAKQALKKAKKKNESLKDFYLRKEKEIKNSIKTLDEEIKSYKALASKIKEEFEKIENQEELKKKLKEFLTSGLIEVIGGNKWYKSNAITSLLEIKKLAKENIGIGVIQVNTVASKETISCSKKENYNETQGAIVPAIREAASYFYRSRGNKYSIWAPMNRGNNHWCAGIINITRLAEKSYKLEFKYHNPFNKNEQLFSEDMANEIQALFCRELALQKYKAQLKRELQAANVKNNAQQIATDIVNAIVTNSDDNNEIIDQLAKDIQRIENPAVDASVEAIYGNLNQALKYVEISTDIQVEQSITSFNHRYKQKDGCSCGVLTTQMIMDEVANPEKVKEKKFPPRAKKLRKAHVDSMVDFVMNNLEVLEPSKLPKAVAVEDDNIEEKIKNLITKPVRIVHDKDKENEIRNEAFDTALGGVVITFSLSIIAIMGASILGGLPLTMLPMVIFASPSVSLIFGAALWLYTCDSLAKEKAEEFKTEYCKNIKCPDYDKMRINTWYAATHTVKRDGIGDTRGL